MSHISSHQCSVLTLSTVCVESACSLCNNMGFLRVLPLPLLSQKCVFWQVKQPPPFTLYFVEEGQFWSELMGMLGGEPICVNESSISRASQGQRACFMLHDTKYGWFSTYARITPVARKYTWIYCLHLKKNSRAWHNLCCAVAEAVLNKFRAQNFHRFLFVESGEFTYRVSSTTK